MSIEGVGYGGLKAQIGEIINSFEKTYDQIGIIKEITRHENIGKRRIITDSQTSQMKKEIKKKVEVTHEHLYRLYRDLQKNLDFSQHLSELGKTYRVYGDGKQKDSSLDVIGNYVVDGFFKYLESDLLSKKIAKGVKGKNKRNSQYNFEMISEHLNLETKLFEEKKFQMFLLPFEDAKENIEKINETLDSAYVDMTKKLKNIEPEINEKELRTYNTSKLVRQYFSFLGEMSKYSNLQLPFQESVKHMSNRLGCKLEKLDTDTYETSQIMNVFNENSKNYFK